MSNAYETTKAALIAAVDAAANDLGPKLRAFEAEITDPTEATEFGEIHSTALDLLNDTKELLGADQFKTNEGGAK